MNQGRQIVIVGATGFTGRLVVAALCARHLAFDIAGRSRTALHDLASAIGLESEPIVVDLSDPLPLLERLRPGALVLNCVGPFGLYSKELLQALVSRSGVYLDVCGEQQFVHESMVALDEPARASGATVIHSCAFESFLADLLAHQLVEPEECQLEELSSFYWFSRILVSPGTRLTMGLVDHFDTVILENDVFRSREPGGEPLHVSALGITGRELAVFAPYPEILFFKRSFNPRNSGSYLLLTPGEARLFSREKERSCPSIDETVSRHRRQPRREPSSAMRARQQCGVAVCASRFEGTSELIRFDGRDSYGLTAEIMAWSCAWILEQSQVASGVLTPGEVFPAKVFFDELRSWTPFFDSLSRKRLSDVECNKVW